MAIQRLRSWLRAVFRRPHLNGEMNDELRVHADLYAADLERGGMPRHEAVRRARAELGSFDGQREAMRESLGLRLLDELRGDVRYALRVLRRSPGFAAVAVLSLGLGIGANTAIFSLLDELMLKALPVERPDHLFFVDNSGGKSEGSNAPPYPCYEILRDTNSHFSGLAMFSGYGTAITIGDVQERILAQHVSGNYFDVIGVRAALGRTLTPADDVPGSGGADGPAAVISHAFWKRRFAMNPNALGTRVELGGKTFTIVGVTPPEFFGLTVGMPIDLSTPVRQSSRNVSTPDSWWFSAVGRLADGHRVEDARAELDGKFQTYMTALNKRPPRPTDYFNRIELVPAAKGLHEIRNRFSAPLAIGMSIVGLVLIIGCANVANLLLARAAARESEMTLRLAIGAGRWRLVRQLLTEGVVLSAIGATAGMLIGRWSLTLLVEMIGGGGQMRLEPKFDARVLWFTTGVVVLTGLLCSIAPALRSTRVARAHVSGRASASARGRVLSRVLVVVQVTLSLVLLCGAALFVRTLRNLESVSAGFRSDGVVMMEAEAPVVRPPGVTDEDLAKSMVARPWVDAAAAIAAVPGVRAASAATLTPLDGQDRGVRLSLLGEPSLPKNVGQGIALNHVTSGFFDTFGVRLEAGRLFTGSDAFATARVALVNQAAARKYFPGSSPVGRIITLTARSAPREIVGIVSDVRYQTLRTAQEPMVYLPLTQPIDAIGEITFAARGDTAALPAASIRDAARRAAPRAYVSRVTSLDEQVSRSLVKERAVSWLAGVFGALALVLACIGLYGQLAYAVVARTREFGIRMAIGAGQASVIWLVLREMMGLVLVALGAGLLLAVGLGRALETSLFGVAPSDPLAIGGAAAVLLTVALAAAYLPARRASRVNPTTALRHE
jgi:predicted permease